MLEKREWWRKVNFRNTDTTLREFTIEGLPPEQVVVCLSLMP
jgi:hypothetical protein